MRDRGRMVLLMEGTVIDVAFFLASEKERRARVVVCLLTATVRTTILREPTKRSYPLVQENKRAVRGCCSPTVSPLFLSLFLSTFLTNGLPIYLSPVTMPSPPLPTYLIRSVFLSLIINENRVHRPSPKCSPANRPVLFDALLYWCKYTFVLDKYIFFSL